MKTSLIRNLTVSLAAALALSAAGINLAHAHKPQPTQGYLMDTDNHFVKNSYGECWRTGYWTPANAVAECDPSLVKVVQAPKKEPVKAAPPPPAPAPTPPAAGPEKAAFEKVTLRAETLFDFDKAVLRPEGKAALDDVVGKMKQFPQVEVVLVTGHTDRIGSDAYNQALSDRRAAAVKNYLISKGIEAGRIEAVGRGEAEPVTTDCKGGPENRRNKKLIACLQPDRRVVLEVKVQRPTQR